MNWVTVYCWGKRLLLRISYKRALMAIPELICHQRKQYQFGYILATNMDDQCIATCNACEEKVSHGKTPQKG